MATRSNHLEGIYGEVLPTHTDFFALQQCPTQTTLLHKQNLNQQCPEIFFFSALNSVCMAVVYQL